MINGGNTGCNLWEPSGGFGPLPSGITGIAGWWESWPAFGSPWIRSDGALSTDITTWTGAINLTITPNQADPDGTFNAYKVVTNGGAGAVAHYLDGRPTNWVSGTYVDFSAWVKPVAPLNWLRWYPGASTQYNNLNTGATSGVVAPDVLQRTSGVDGDWQYWLGQTRGGAGLSGIQTLVYTANDTPSSTYDAGAGGDGFYIYLPWARQERLQQLNNLITGGVAATSGGIVQQPLFQNTFDTLSPFAVPKGESGRAVVCQVVGDVAVNNCFNQVGANHIIFGIRRLDNATASMVYRAAGAGTETDWLDALSANQWRWFRRDAGSVTANIAYGPLPVASTSPVSFCHIADQVNGNTLFINGTLVANAAPEGLTLAGVSSLRLIEISATAPSVFPATAILPNPGGNHTTLYNTLVRPSLLGMWRRWLAPLGVTPP